MTREPSSFSDDEIEQILGMGASEAKITLREIRDAIRKDPLLVTGLVFAVGILVGVSLAGGGNKRT